MVGLDYIRINPTIFIHGVITMKNDLVLLLANIDKAKDITDLQLYHQSLSIILQKESVELEKIQEIFLLLSKVHDHLMIKALALAEEEVNQNGIGIKPNKICWYIMGSGARKEQTVWTDQDNGIMYTYSPQNKEESNRYVQYYAKIGTANLAKIGYPYCPGNVMATNSRWAKEINEWKITMLNHINNYQPDDVRYLLIASDLRGIYGDKDLITEARTYFFQLFRSNPTLLQRVQEHATNPPVPIGSFGQIFTERWGKYSGQLDLKNSIYVQLVNCVKALAFYADVQEYPTLERIEKLYEKSVISEQLKEQIKQSFLVSLYLRLKFSINNKNPDYHIYLKQLDNKEYQSFKKALQLAKKLQRYVLKWNGDPK